MEREWSNRAPTLHWATFLLCISLFQPCNPAKAAVITGVSSGGVGYVTITQDATGVNASVGLWDPDNPSQEPLGDSQFYVDIDVQTGGTVSFTYSLRTKDISQYDWMDIYLEVPGGQYTVINGLGGPGDVNQVFYETPRVSRSVDLTPWAGEQIRLVVSVHQDGFVDQTQAQIFGLGIRSCPVGPETPITDPEAQQLHDSPVDESRLTQKMQEKLGCLRQAVQDAHGTLLVISAWRNQAYQSHLYEVRERWKKLKNNRDPACATLRQQALDHMLLHMLDTTLERPVARTAGHHPLGVAIDAAWSANIDIDALAAGCQMRRPFLDCSEAGKKRGACDRVHIELIESLWGEP